MSLANLDFFFNQATIVQKKTKLSENVVLGSSFIMNIFIIFAESSVAERKKAAKRIFFFFFFYLEILVGVFFPKLLQRVNVPCRF